MMIGGTDIVAFSKDHADRVAHSHLKDVNSKMAEKVRSHEVTYYDGMIAGLYTPLGKGDANIRTVVRNLVMAGYEGWFVLEQDNALSAEPEIGGGPFADAKASVEFLREVLAELVAEGY